MSAKHLAKSKEPTERGVAPARAEHSVAHREGKMEPEGENPVLFAKPEKGPAGGSRLGHEWGGGRGG